MVCGSENICMILTREDIEIIADNIIDDFKHETGIDTSFTMIEQLATDYLKLRVTFERLSNDSGFCGITAYKDTTFKTVVDGNIKIIKIAKNQVILDSDFVEVGKIRELCGKRRFTLAHEVAHQILFSLESVEEKLKYDKMYSARKAHTIRELKTFEDWNEWQANALGAALLMPRSSVDAYIMAFKRAIKEQMPIGLQNVSLYSKYIIDSFCDYFHVSKSAGIIRLQQLGYIADDVVHIQREIAYG